jgi:hypothetical protein
MLPAMIGPESGRRCDCGYDRVCRPVNAGPKNCETVKLWPQVVDCTGAHSFTAILKIFGRGASRGLLRHLAQHFADDARDGGHVLCGPDAGPVIGFGGYSYGYVFHWHLRSS